MMLERAVLFDQFVGREKELAFLIGVRSESAREVRANIVAVVGEAGIGKSRLLSEFEHAVRRERGAFVRVLCEEPPVPYAPFARALDVLLTHRGLRASPTVVAALDAVTIADRDDGDTGLDRRGVRHAALLAAFSEASKRLGHVTFVIDDAHWADLSSLEALRAMPRGLAHCAITVVLAYRPEDLESDHKRILALTAVEREGAARVTLGPLSFGDMLPLWNAPLPGAKRGVLRRIYDLAEGKPFAAEELTRSALEPAAGLHLTSVPSLREAVLERMERLGAADRAVIERAAVLGRDFSPEDLQALGASSGELFSALRAGLGLQLLEEREAGGQPWYRFRHALTREILYEHIGEAERKAMHRAIADHLEATDRVAEFAYHVYAGGDTARALDANERAGDAAIGLAAYADAVPLLRRACELATDDTTLARVGAKLVRCLEFCNETDALLETCRSLVETLARAGRSDDAIDIIATAFHAVQMTRFADVLQLTLRANELLATATEPSARFNVELMNAWIATCRTDLTEALAACDRGAAAVVRPTTAQSNRLAITRAVANLEASRLIEAERALGERIHEATPEGDRALATTNATLAILEYARGRTASAFEHCIEAAGLYRRLHHERLAFIQECNAALYAAEIGNFSYVADVVDRGRAKGDLQNDILEAARVRMMRAVGGGDLHELLALYERAVENRMNFLVAALARDLAFMVEDDRELATSIALRAFACARPGQLDEQLVRAAIEYGRPKDIERIAPLLEAAFTDDEVFLRANEALGRARLAAHEHRSIEAVRYARLALELGARTERWLHLSAAYELAGEFDAARATLERVGAVAELRRLERRRPVRRLETQAEAQKLSAREEQIARLVAFGYSSREVGLRLAIGTRTVETHLAKIYGKLGIGSRAELMEMIKAKTEP